MNLVLLSDTHTGHEGLKIPPCDLLAHAGDFSRFGTREETLDFFNWYGAQPARVKVLTGGNHDLFAEREPSALRALAREHKVLWLVEEGAEVLGLRVWASPYSPKHGQWAFQEERGAASKARWDAFPSDLDLLITHGPPHGICDTLVNGTHVGCEALREAVQARPPRLHLFGHVHEAHGEARIDGLPTRFVNASNFVSLSVRRASSLAVRPHCTATL